MASVNKVILVGNLGRDPEMRSFPSGDQVANASLATTDKWKDKQSGEPREHTEWHRLTFSGRLAEIAGQYLRKGSQIYIEGSLRTRKWQDSQSGQDRYSTEIRVDHLQMLGGPRESGGENERPAQAQSRRSSGHAESAPPRTTQGAAPKGSTGSGFDDFDSDIPF